MLTIPNIVADWTGPFAWLGFELENNLPTVPDDSGIYLWTVPHREGFLIYAAGMTTRSIRVRLREHTSKYLCGDYHVLDIECMADAHRRNVWTGWEWSDEKRAEFDRRRDELISAAKRQLAGFRLFVAPVSTDRRILYRAEAAIMNRIYTCEPPFCNIPDRGMSLAPRWDSETPILMRNECNSTLFGLPQEMEI